MANDAPQPGTGPSGPDGSATATSSPDAPAPDGQALAGRHLDDRRAHIRVIDVEDAEDPRLREIRDLNDPTARRATDARHGCFIIEGLTALDASIRAGASIRHLVSDERTFERVATMLRDAADAGPSAPITVYRVPRPALQEAAGFAFHRGVLGVADRPDPVPVDDVVSAAGGAPIVIAEAVSDNENVGALFRNAAAFGIGGVLLDAATADPLYRRSIRVSVGHVLTVPWTRAETLDGIEAVRTAGYRTVALSPGGSTDLASLAAGAPVAWLLGAEGPGLSPTALAAADVRAAIPMAPGVDSLNVATAAAVAFALTRDHQLVPGRSADWRARSPISR